MDVEQRIGRIHRYKQEHTAQVYNLVLSDTIEGSIFLLLDAKLVEIARTLGKVDQQGNVAEDLHVQILGQLSEKLSYDKLYRDAISDPELRRTEVELEAAPANAKEARSVVFELFQDLDGFSLDDYAPFANVEEGFDRIVRFMENAVHGTQQSIKPTGPKCYSLMSGQGAELLRFTTDRDQAREADGLTLLGLDHPMVAAELARWQGLEPEYLGLAVSAPDASAIVAFWMIETHGAQGEHRRFVQPLAVSLAGQRNPALERRAMDALEWPPTAPTMASARRRALLVDSMEPMLQREVQRHGLVAEQGGYTAKLIGWVEMSPAVS